ncbi:3-deoxy-D-manno-octulosonic acid transferase [Candidatus Gullanella endobia]|uniref:3-deoxy-D-manno-octulosonic acid transferase n=1 Tax=Candidatus Gullanella endobia TaxID=1070130 RepID=A0A143WR95_9ENTR|nr:lipid IV(A) 3-deoxy-D-manno-octulosonic acid transferase [Candidatus Gullanella endobia]CUX96230.1 3-deoxy-D-manno-octulosonic acid transferase [Candidatus Gullanella endobia]
MIYNVIILLIKPLLWIQLLFRIKKEPTYRQRLTERYGFCQGKVKPGGIMLHSVSVGETMAAIPLVRALQYRYPTLPITITTMTSTGSQLVQLEFSKDIYHVYLPYDFPKAITRFLNQVNPRLVIIMETELWPNLIKAIHHRGIPLVVANARLSARSAANYKRFNSFVSSIMRRITLVAAQNEEDGARFLELGLKKNQLVVTGNLKFDISITKELSARIFTMRRQWALHRPVWIAASTHAGEEKLLLQAHRKLLTHFPDLLLIIVPRHPERFLVVEKMTMKAGFDYVMRSIDEIPSNGIQVVVGDTIGELMLLYGIADLAFIGGSLVEKGGHNPIEAVVHSIPVLMGPHTFNFSNICNKLDKAGGLITVTDVESLVKSVLTLLKNEDYRIYYSNNAIKVLNQNQGALQRLLNLLEPYLIHYS